MENKIQHVRRFGMLQSGIQRETYSTKTLCKTKKIVSTMSSVSTMRNYLKMLIKPKVSRKN